LAGSGDAWPFWLTFLKQPFAVGARRQAVLAAVLREVALGVRVVVRVDDRDRRVRLERRVELYALARSGGPRPAAAA